MAKQETLPKGVGGANLTLLTFLSLLIYIVSSRIIQ